MAIPVPDVVALEHYPVHSCVDACAAAKQHREDFRNHCGGVCTGRILVLGRKHHQLPLSAPQHVGGPLQAVLDPEALLEALQGAHDAEPASPALLGACLGKGQRRRVRTEASGASVGPVEERAPVRKVCAALARAPAALPPGANLRRDGAEACGQCYIQANACSSRPALLPRRESHTRVVSCSRPDALPQSSGAVPLARTGRRAAPARGEG
mmetsp:Transcript_6651/g.15161  ORF Transcript_6651/g.15161 Transcript_6651/m.15161 type:complete len:211 (+) Transcript_6651:229-861(+)